MLARCLSRCGPAARVPGGGATRRADRRALSEASARQLEALRQVVARLDEASIEHWLFGGWAVDFHVGRVTRPHDDLDLAIWLDDLPRIAALLESDGWRHAPDPEEDGGTGYERDGVRLELTYLARDNEGVYTPLRSAKPYWPDDALGADMGELDRVRCRVVSLAALQRTKARTRDDPEEAAKDRADSAALAELES
jgi:hypothetical protein